MMSSPKWYDRGDKYNFKDLTYQKQFFGLCNKDYQFAGSAAWKHWRWTRNPETESNVEIFDN